MASIPRNPEGILAILRKTIAPLAQTGAFTLGLVSEPLCIYVYLCVFTYVLTLFTYVLTCVSIGSATTAVSSPTHTRDGVAATGSGG